jgi:Protein of unknown function (DUF1573)
MKKILLALALIGTFAGVQGQDSKVSPDQLDNKNAPELKLEVEEYNFGTIKQGEKVNFDFKFVNAGKEPLIITAANGTCGCTVPSYPKEPIAKNGKGVIHVEFNSTGKMGMQDKTVTITSNSKGGPKILHLKGNVEAPAPVPGSASPAPASK